MTLDRPRDRTTLNFNPQFIELRNEVTKYMIGINEEAKALRTESNVSLPDLMPIDFNTLERKPRSQDRSGDVDNGNLPYDHGTESEPELISAGTNDE